MALMYYESFCGISTKDKVFGLNSGITESMGMVGQHSQERIGSDIAEIIMEVFK